MKSKRNLVPLGICDGIPARATEAKLRTPLKPFLTSEQVLMTLRRELLTVPWVKRSPLLNPARIDAAARFVSLEKDWAVIEMYTDVDLVGRTSGSGSDLGFFGSFFAFLASVGTE